MPTYKREFYEATRINMASALEIVPTLIQLIGPRTVVDLGCGVGGWLAAFIKEGVKEVDGYDGEWVHLDDLLIPKSQFHRHDLKIPLPKTKEYDLAISLEVAEHLPPECAADFVQTLTALSKVVLFSAAIPYQGGTNHFNEQWPTYWIELFRKNGFGVVDCLRMKFWSEPKVRWWYSQNTMIFVSEPHLERYPALAKASREFNLKGMPLVHPRKWEKQCDPRKLLLRASVKKTFQVLAALLQGSGRKPDADV